MVRGGTISSRRIVDERRSESFFELIDLGGIVT